jgi:hypothetical protein
LCQRKFNTLILDSDNDVIQAVLKSLGDLKNCTARAYETADELLDKGYDIGVLDPPWYKELTYSFMNRALAAVKLDGEVFCTLPPRLTRPDAEELMQELVKDLIELDHEVLRLERGTIEYQVPRFELAALKRKSIGFDGTPWRSGDLLQIRKRSDRELSCDKPNRNEHISFARNPVEFRIFSRRTDSAKGGLIIPLDKYSFEVSTRAHSGEVPDVWSTEKIGIQTSNNTAVCTVLECWAKGGDQEAPIAILISNGWQDADARHLVRELDQEFKLWAQFAAQPPLRVWRQLFFLLNDN